MLKKIKESDEIFAPAHKSKNIYLLSKDEYQKLITVNITKTNRKKFTTSITKQSQWQNNFE